MCACHAGRGHLLYLFTFGAMSGERQEHVVEAGPGQSDVVDFDLASRSQPATRVMSAMPSAAAVSCRAGVHIDFGARPGD